MKIAFSDDSGYVVVVMQIDKFCFEENCKKSFEFIRYTTNSHVSEFKIMTSAVPELTTLIR